MTWIENKNQPANLVFAYFEEPDKTGHKKGVGSKEIKNQIVRVDNTVKYVYNLIIHDVNLITLQYLKTIDI